MKTAYNNMLDDIVRSLSTGNPALVSESDLEVSSECPGFF